MKLASQICWVITFVGAFHALFAQDGPQQFTYAPDSIGSGFSDGRLVKLDQLLEGYIRDGVAPNAVVFVARDGNVVYNKAFGYSNINKRKVSSVDDIYRIASQSKAIATVGLLTLFEEGKFLLDDPISRYLPEFGHMRVLAQVDSATGAYKATPAHNAITIRQLLTHTAGIPYEHPLQSRPEFSLPFFCSQKPDRLKDTMKKLAARPLVCEPGTQFVYGLNTDVIGYLIEVLSNQPLDKFLNERVLQPLGMTDTHFYLPDSKAARLVELYSKPTHESTLTVNTNDTYREFAIKGAKTYFSAGAGLVSTAEDYAKFCQMILNKGSFNNHQILSRKTVEMMTRNQIGDLEVWDRKDHFGLGFQIISEGSHYGGNATPGSLTWGGMYCSEFTIDPKEKLILLIFTNVHPYAHYSEFLLTFRNVVYQALE